MPRTLCVIHLDHFAKLRRHGEPDGVGNVQGGRAGIDDGGEHLAQELWIGAGRILGRELHVLARKTWQNGPSRLPAPNTSRATS